MRPTTPKDQPEPVRPTRGRRLAALLTALAASVTWGAVNAPDAAAANYYKCSFTASTTSVKFGKTVTLKVRYTNLNTNASSAWTDGNTNPVIFIKNSSGKSFLEMIPDTSYWVGPNSTVELTFIRGPVGLSAGKTYGLEAVMYYADAKGNTTTEMPGTSCSAKLKVT